MHIAIEGIDGVGKTTLARRLAKEINFHCIEKHLHALTDGEDIDDIPNSMQITSKVNASEFHIEQTNCLLSFVLFSDVSRSSVST